MLPQIKNDNEGSNNTAAEQREEIFNKISDSLRVETLKPISDTAVIKIVTDFTKSLQKENKTLLENITEEDSKLLKETVQAISKLQGKTVDSIDNILKMAEKLILAAQTNKNPELERVGQQLKETTLAKKYDAAGFTLRGSDDTFKNRLTRYVTGTTPKQAFVQGTTVFGHMRKEGSRGFREGLGQALGLKNNFFITDEERREDIRRRADYENKQIAAAEQSSADLDRALNISSGNAPDENRERNTANGQVTTSLSNPSDNIDTTTKSDRQEIRAGIRDTDAEFSRSATVSGEKDHWQELMDILEKIRKCVCECQCGNGGGIDGLPPKIPNAAKAAAAAAAAAAVAAVALAVSTVAENAVTLANTAKNTIKNVLGVGTPVRTAGGAEPQYQGGTPERVSPTAPAEKVTKPSPIERAMPKNQPTPAPANDPGVKTPTPANENERFVEQQQQKRVANDKYGIQTQGEEEPVKPKPKEGKVEPKVRNTKPTTPVAESPAAPKPPSNVVEGRFPPKTPGLAAPTPKVGWGTRLLEGAKGVGRSVAKSVLNPRNWLSRGNAYGIAAEIALTPTPLNVGEDAAVRKMNDNYAKKMATPEGRAAEAERVKAIRQNSPVSANDNAKTVTQSPKPIAANDNVKPAAAKPVNATKPWYERAWESTKSVASGTARITRNAASTAWQGIKTVATAPERLGARAGEAVKGGIQRFAPKATGMMEGWGTRAMGAGQRLLASEGAAGSVARGGSKILGGAAKVLGRVATPLTIGMGAYESYTGWQDANKAEKAGKLTHHQANKARGKAVGSGAGGAGGALAGAAAGAAIGSIVPGVGTVIGGAVGGLVGYYGGSWLGGKAGEAVGGIGTSDKPVARTAPKAAAPARAAIPARVAPQATRTAGLETGRNQDAAHIERGTDRTATKPVINVPPPTVIQAPAANKGNDDWSLGMSGFSGSRSARSDESSWLRFQQRRAVG